MYRIQRGSDDTRRIPVFRVPSFELGGSFGPTHRFLADMSSNFQNGGGHRKARGKAYSDDRQLSASEYKISGFTVGNLT